MENLEQVTEEEILDEGQEDVAQDDSIERAIEDAFKEVKGNENTETNNALDGQSSETAEKPDTERSRANSSKKTKRKTIEASELSTEPAQTEPVQSQANERIEPPHRLPLEMKERFNQLPPELQKQYAEDWGAIEGNTTKLWQDLNREKSRYSDVNGLIDTYVSRWGSRGLTPVQAAAELFALNDMVYNDPIGGSLEIISRAGVTPEMLIQHRDQGQQFQSQPYYQQQQVPQQNYLTEDNFYEKMQEYQSMQQSQAYESQAVSELQAMKSELGNDGKYVWPELHSPETLQRVEPLVNDLLKTQQVSFVDATKKAIQALRYLNGITSSPSQPGQRLPTSDNQQFINKAKQASVSISGRGGASKPAALNTRSDVSLEDSIEAAFASLSDNF